MNGRAARLVLIGVMLVGAFALRLVGITEPSVEQRETQSALLVRQWYLDDRSSLPNWQQRVLPELPRLVRPIEPPVIDVITLQAFRIIGGENFWFPRGLSALLWVLGGIFLYLIAKRIAARAGPVVALALYLVWPLAAWLSRLYMPDALLIFLLLAAVLTVIRFFEQQSRSRFLVAAAVSGLATAAKPGVAFLFLVALFVALALSRRELRDAISSGRLPAFAAFALMPAMAYYLYGTQVSDFIWSGASTRRITPELLITGSFWRGWWEMVSFLLRFPQPQELLAVAPLAAGIAGLVLAPRGLPRAVLGGLVFGYIAFGLTFANYTSTHPYYSLPLVPILALAIGVLCGRVLDRLGNDPVWPRRVLLAFVALVIGFAALKSHAGLSASDNGELIRDYERIGTLTNHTTRAIVVDDRLSTPIMYWGWIVGEAWELDYNERPPPWIDVDAAEYLVVVGTHQLTSSAGLQRFARGRPVVARTPRFAIFDLRDASNPTD